jgi:hypothetical protein
LVAELDGSADNILAAISQYAPAAGVSIYPPGYGFSNDLAQIVPVLAGLLPVQGPRVGSLRPYLQVVP